MFVDVGTLIKTLPRRLRAPEAILALHVRQAFADSLKNICADLPKETLEPVKARIFKNGVLTIVCSQLVSAELSMRSGGLISDINKTLGRRIVTKLRFRAG